MQTVHSSILRALCVTLLLAAGCTGAKLATPKVSAPAGSSPTSSDSGGAVLDSLRFQPKSGTWQVAGKADADKVKPFTVVLEFQPNGYIGINGKLLTEAQVAKEPSLKDYINQSTYLGQEKIAVIFHLGGQYTLTLTAPGQMEGVASINGEQLAAVKLTWISESTTP